MGRPAIQLDQKQSVGQQLLVFGSPQGPPGGKASNWTIAAFSERFLLCKEVLWLMFLSTISTVAELARIN